MKPSKGRGEVRVSFASTFDPKESYKSLNEALGHGGIAERPALVHAKYFDSQEIEGQGPPARLLGALPRGCWSPGGFDASAPRARSRRLRWRVRRTRVCRSWLCHRAADGAVIEYARTVLGPVGAQTPFEFDEKTRTPWSCAARSSGGT